MDLEPETERRYQQGLAALAVFLAERDLTLDALADLPARYMGVHCQDFVRSLWDTPAATRGQAEDALKAFSHYFGGRMEAFGLGGVCCARGVCGNLL